MIVAHPDSIGTGLLLLVDEVGTDPESETQALYLEILDRPPTVIPANAGIQER